MAVYWLTFRINIVTLDYSNPNYRRTNLINKIRDISERTWEEPTSFILFESKNNYGEIISICKSTVSLNSDIVVVGTIGDSHVTVIGDVEKGGDLSSMIPSATYI